MACTSDHKDARTALSLSLFAFQYQVVSSLTAPWFMILCTQPRHTFHCSCVSSRTVFIHQKSLRYDVPCLTGNTHTEDSVCGQRTTHFAHESGEYIKKCVRAGPEHKILFCGSGCTGAVKRLQVSGGISPASSLFFSTFPCTYWQLVGPELTWRCKVGE
jgi:hypothetical protein